MAGWFGWKTLSAKRVAHMQHKTTKLNIEKTKYNFPAILVSIMLSDSFAFKEIHFALNGTVANDTSFLTTAF